ncbi:hypothetical protein ACOMHN_001095 [Nucella lapillus]
MKAQGISASRTTAVRDTGSPVTDGFAEGSVQSMTTGGELSLASLTDGCRRGAFWASRAHQRRHVDGVGKRNA